MSDQQSMYKAILANPNDRAPRLIYADWLEETNIEKKIARAREIREAIASGIATYSPNLPKSRANSISWVTYLRNGFVELLYISPSLWVDESEYWTRSWPINQVIFSKKPSLPWERKLLSTGVDVICYLASGTNDGANTTDSSPLKIYQTLIPYPAEMNQSSKGILTWANEQADQLARSLTPYEALWPQISFHYIVKATPEDEGDPGYAITPETDRSLSDLLGRHAYHDQISGSLR